MLSPLPEVSGTPWHKSTTLIGARCTFTMPGGSRFRGIVRDRHDDGSFAVFCGTLGRTEIVEAADIIIDELPRPIR
jgi:hypothetical protein